MTLCVRPWEALLRGRGHRASPLCTSGVSSAKRRHQVGRPCEGVQHRVHPAHSRCPAKACASLPPLTLLHKSAGCVPGISPGGLRVGGFRTPPGTSSPDPAAPKGRALSPDLLLRGPLRGTTLRQHCLKCRFLSPARRDLLLSLFTSLSSDCGPLRWGLCPRIQSSWIGAGGRLREDADRRQAQGQGEKPQGKGAWLPPVEGAVDLQTTWPPTARPPDPKEGISEGSPGGPHLGVQNSARCLTIVYFLSSSFTGCQLSAFLFFSLSPTLSLARALSLDKRATETERTESEPELKKGPLDQPPPQPHRLNPSLLFLTRKQPWGGERMCAGFGEPGTGSRHPSDSCSDGTLSVHRRRGVRSLEGP